MAVFTPTTRAIARDERVVGALADGDGRQPARHGDGARRSAWRSDSGDGSSPRRVPTLCAMAILPLVLYRVIGPEVRRTPEAPAAARQALAALGPLSRQEWIVLVVFLGDGGALGLGRDARPRFDGDRVPRPGRAARDRRHHARRHRQAGRRARDVHLVRGALHAQQSAQRAGLHGIPRPETRRGPRRPGDADRRPRAGAAYVLLHYLFVSQTAHLLALFGVFLDVGVKLGVNPTVLAFQLLFATNYFAAITPQGSSANLLFAGSGYLTQGDLYRLGAITTAVSVAIYLRPRHRVAFLVAR